MHIANEPTFEIILFQKNFLEIQRKKQNKAHHSGKIARRAEINQGNDNEVF